jgi:hypothetical protein
MKMYLKRINKLEDRIDEKDPDIYKIPDTKYLYSYKRWKKREPNKRFVLKISRNVMWYVKMVDFKF